MKYQDIVPFYQKLNYNCKTGTVDDSNRCSDDIPAKNNILLDSIIQNKIKQHKPVQINNNDYIKLAPEYGIKDLNSIKKCDEIIQNISEGGTRQQLARIQINDILNGRDSDLKKSLKMRIDVETRIFKGIDKNSKVLEDYQQRKNETINNILTTSEPTLIHIGVPFESDWTTLNTSSKLDKQKAITHVETYYQKLISKLPKNEDPVLYRKGGYHTNDIESYTTDPKGAQIKIHTDPNERLTPSFHKSFSELQSDGWNVLSGANQNFGYSGESEIILINLKNIANNSKQNSTPIKLNYKCKSGTVDDSNKCGTEELSENISVDLTAPTQKSLETLIQGDYENDPIPWDEDYNIKMGSKIYQVRLEGWYDDCLESRGYDNISPKDYQQIIEDDFKNIVLDESGWDKSKSNDYIFGYVPEVKGTTYGVTYIGRPIKKIKQNSASSVKLNFRCPKGTVDETFSCGKTPEEAKKNYEKLQKDKSKSATKSPEKQAPARMDAKDIIRRIQSGGKITLEEKNYVQMLLSGESPEPAKVDPAPIKKFETVITKAKKEIASGKVSEKTKKELKNNIDSAKKELISSNGLDLIQQEITKAGGPIPYFKRYIEPNAEMLSQDEFKPKSVSTLNSEYKSKLKDGNIIKTVDGITYSELRDKTIVASIGKDVVGYIKSYKNFVNQNETDISVATEHQGKQLGTKLMMEFYDKNPDKIKVPGGFTPAGKKATIRLLEEISKRGKTKQNSTPLIKLSMKHPGNWSTATSLDTKIKKELKIGIQDVLDVLKSVGYFKEDPKEVALNEAYKKIAQEIFDTHIKLNYNCPADEKIGSGKGSCSGNTDNKSSDVIPDIPKDIVLGKDFDTIRAAINRKEFNLKTTKKEGMYETTYRIMISPKKIPQNWKSKINSIDSATTWYDPKYMKEVPFGNGKSTILKPINPEMEKVTSLPSGKESGYLFRGMSYEEFENINESGFIKTLAEYNFDFQGDMTFFADDKGTASNYASGFAPWQYGPTIDKPAVMIKIRDPGNHEPGTTEGEIGIKGKIPADLIEEVYFGHPVSMTQGYTEIINDKFNKSVYKGNGSSYKATVAWESRPYKNQKQNANCKEEEKVGSGPGSCSGGLKDSIQPTKVDLHPKLSPGDFDSMLKASKAIRNDKSEPDKVLRRMMAEEVERKFVRETKEAVQATKESNDEFIKNSGNDTWNKLSSESQSAIRGYTASDYGVINSALAEGIERPEVALIKAAMKPLEKETILYRGVSFDLPKEVIKFGTIWENKPFASCSTGSFIAEEAALGKLTHDGVAKIPTVLEILTSKNTKGFAVGKNSFHAVADAGSEVILDTGTKFQTLSVDKSGGIRKITVRVVDD